MLRYEIRGVRIVHDDLIAEYLIDPNRNRYGIDKMLIKYTAVSYTHLDVYKRQEYG